MKKMDEIKQHQKKIFELLAPAGSYDIFKAVIAAGADAVYVGGNMFGARAYASNFSEEELLSAIDYAHLHGRKVYLTVNTLLKNTEMVRLFEYLLPFYEKGLDAVLVQDIGVMEYIHEHFPELPIHTSTQMTITGTQGARLLQRLGAERIVMAREMSLQEMRYIHEETGIEIEAFVHGALCYCYSGQCLFSSMLGGRSGNRGRCAQPCRLAYSVLDEYHREYQKDSFILSLKDMCGINELNRLQEAGVYSLKIEGRMKQLPYAAGVVSYYRKQIDRWMETQKTKISDSDMHDVEALGNRCGFTTGYYDRQNGSDMVTFVKPSYEKSNTEIQKKIIQTYGTDKKKIPVYGKLVLYTGKPAVYELTWNDSSVFVKGMEVMTAQKKPLAPENIKERLNKTGDTLFEMQHIEVVADPDVFLPNGELNRLRREGLHALQEKMLCGYRRTDAKQTEEEKASQTGLKKQVRDRIICQLENRKLLSAVVENRMVTDIYMDCMAYDWDDFVSELDADVKTIRKNNKKVFLAMPRIFRNKTSVFFETMTEEWKRISLDGFLVRTYEELEFIRTYFPESAVVTDHNLYTYNDLSELVLEKIGVSRNTVPVELNRKEIMHRNNENSQMVIYGYYPLMTSAQCVHKNTKKCDRTPGICYLKDRYQVQFPVRNYCRACYNVIYNSLPVMLFSNLDEIRKSGIHELRLDFTIETEKQVRKILKLFETFMVDRKAEYPPEWQDKYTNGHYKRGVE